MGQEQDQPRSFVSRYWVVIVIALWLIAWSARDVLAPGGEATLDGDSPAPVAVAEDSPPEPRASDEQAKPEPGASDEQAKPEPRAPAARSGVAAQADAVKAPSETDSGAVAPAAQTVLDAARAVYWSEGPEAAAQRLREGLEGLSEGSVQRADVYGELGNVLYHAGQIADAMAAWDQALEHLPARERRAMQQRLAPLYGRHHPDGLQHLQRLE
ncbi:MAG: hypothetical protein ACQETK_07345 [Pseudomonadota bacterium]